MSCEEYREDLEAFVLDALEAEEARRVDAHLAVCSSCSQIVRAYRVAADELALAVPIYHAPPRLKQRIMGGIGEVRPFLLPRFLTTRWAAAAAALALIGLALGALSWAIMLSAEVDKLRSDNAQLAALTELDGEQRRALLRLQADLNMARSSQQNISKTLEEQATLLVIALDPELEPSVLQGTTLAPNANCSYVYSSAQHLGALTCREIPSTAFGLTYELWATKGDKTVPLGSFYPRIDGSAQMLVKFPPETPGPLTNMWVTLETTQNATNTAQNKRPSHEVVLQRVPDQQAAR